MMTLYKLKCLLHHLWLDADDTRKALPPDLLQKLTQQVAASESRHTGEIRICVEAALPASYVWRLGPDDTMAQLIRQRALMMFGKLHVWDTEYNNGVLIYLLMGENAIEIVADRALSRKIPHAFWNELVVSMGDTFRQGRFEDGLTQALLEVSALLKMHFPTGPDVDSGQINELPDEPFLG